MVRKFITTLVIGGFAAFAAGSVSAAGNDCTIAKPGENPVAKACKKGGIKEAKKVMKAMVANAKKAGKKMRVRRLPQERGRLEAHRGRREAVQGPARARSKRSAATREVTSITTGVRGHPSLSVGRSRHRGSELQQQPPDLLRRRLAPRGVADAARTAPAVPVPDVEACQRRGRPRPGRRDRADAPPGPARSTPGGTPRRPAAAPPDRARLRSTRPRGPRSPPTRER